MLIFSILAHIIVNVKNQAELAEHQPEVSEQLLKIFKEDNNRAKAV